MKEKLALLTPWFAALAPSAITRPSTWAEANLRLPRSSNARPGPLRLTAMQRQLIDAASEPGVRELVLMAGTQVGKSLAINSLLSWVMAGDAGPVLLVRPDDSDAKSYVRENLDPLIEASPALKAIVGAGADGLDGVNFKTFPGGSLAVASSWKAAALSGRAIRVLICDEVDRFAQVVSGGEGEPVALAKRRLQTFSHNSLTILASSPTLKATSRIAHHHARGDQRVFKVPCLACGERDDLTADRLVFEAGKPETARLTCLCCGNKATEADRLVMLDNGEFVATATGEPGVVSFHLSELASEFSSLSTVAASVDAAKTIDAKKVLANTTWGLPFETDAEAEIDPADLQSRAIRLAAPYPATIDFVTAGVDIQLDRIEISYLAQAATETFLLDHVVLPGDTSGAHVFGMLDEANGRTFRIQDGRTLAIAATFVDAGFQTQAVVDFVIRQRARGRKVWPVFGRSGFDRPALKLGSKIRNLVRGYTLGVDTLKLNVLKALAATDASVTPIRLPDHLDAQVYQQLTAERLEVKYIKGYARHVWAKDRHARNEALDCLVYAAAAAMTVSGRETSVTKQNSSQTILDKMLATANSMKADK